MRIIDNIILIMKLDLIQRVRISNFRTSAILTYQVLGAKF